MPVTLVTTPDDHALTKGGRMLYEFTGSGRNLTTGVKAINVLAFRTPIPDGTRLVLRWAGKTVEVIARTTPQAPNEFPAGDGTSAYLGLIEPFFQEYFPFREDFEVHGSDFGTERGIVLTALVAGAAFNMTGTISLPPASLARVENRAPGQDPLERTQYSIYTELWLQRAGTDGSLRTHYDRVFSAPIETDEQGLARFDAGGVLHSELAADWPAWNGGAVTAARKSHRRYFLCYAEAWGRPLQVGRVKTDVKRHAYLGGADYQRRAGSGFSLTGALLGNGPAADRALRLDHGTRYVRPDEPQFLTFVNLRTDAPETISIDFFLKFDDQSTANAPVTSNESFPVGAKLTYAIGVAQRNLLALVPAGKQLLEYYVKIRTSSADFSAQYRYVVNYDYQPYTRYFAYLNSLGAVETLTTFGKGSAELNRFFEQAERFLPARYDAADGQFVDYDVSVQQQVDVTTGYRSAAHLTGWTDFYRSPSRFRLRGPVALPVGIVSKSIKQAKDGDTLFAHAFTYAYLYKDDFYSAETDDSAQGAPPPNFQPAGAVTVSPVTVVNARDPSIDDAVRQLTPTQIAQILSAAGRPNPETLGFMTEQTGSQVFRHVGTPIKYPDLTLKPTNRDEAGLVDVPTVNESLIQAFKLKRIKPTLKSWTGSVEPT